jgi:hypothetical protein
MQGLLRPVQANLGYFVVWFQSFQLPLTQTESPLALIHLAPKSHVSFEVCTQLGTEFFIFYISIWINCNRISEGLLYYIPWIQS